MSTQELINEWQIEAVQNLREAFSYQRRAKYLPYRFPHKLRVSPMPAQATEEELIAAENGVYNWWWRFLRESPEYPPQQSADAPSEIVDLYKDFGELGEDFRTWWQTTGRDVFAEPHGPAVRVLMDERSVDHDEFPNVLILQLELRLPKEQITAEVDAILAEVHPGEALRPKKYTRARRPAAHDVDDKVGRWQEYLDVWREASKYPVRERNWAQIGQDLGDKQQIRTELARKIEGHYVRAEQLIHHAARGVFPCFAEVRPRMRKKVGRPKKAAKSQ